MEKGKLTENLAERETEQVVLVAVVRDKQELREAEEYLDELRFLAETAGVETVATFTQKLSYPDKRTFVGSGKLQEIKEYITENEIGAVIFDDELSPSQTRNLEKELGIKIMDRTRLILDIFAQRATTAYAKTQVELAQLQYLLPRLTGMWTHLERQRGGDRNTWWGGGARDRDRPADHSRSHCEA